MTTDTAVEPSAGTGLLDNVSYQDDTTQNKDAVAIDHHEVTIDGHAALELAVHRVVARQVCVGFRVAQVVEGDDLDSAGALGFVESTQHVAADAAIAVDGDTDRHEKLQAKVEDIEKEIARLSAEGFVTTSGNTKPFRGADNKLVIFFHPKTTNGVLIELCQEIK